MSALSTMSTKQAIVIAVLGVSFHFGTAMSRAEDTNLVQAARREGRVVWYTVAGESQQLAQEFEKKYPFVKVEVVRSTVYPMLTRILNETRAGNYFLTLCVNRHLPLGNSFRGGY